MVQELYETKKREVWMRGRFVAYREIAYRNLCRFGQPYPLAHYNRANRGAMLGCRVVVREVNHGKNEGVRG